MEDLKVKETKDAQGGIEHYTVVVNKGGYYEKSRFENKEKTIAYINSLKGDEKSTLLCDKWISILEQS